MSHSKKIILFLLTGLIGCSTIKYHEIQPVASATSRSVASVVYNLDEVGKLKKDIEGLFNNIFYAYLMSQIFIEDFDMQLDKNPELAMKSNSYSLLLATRVLVDEFEHDVNDLYITLVLATALPGHSLEQKKNAQVALDIISKMMMGYRSEDNEIPENLKHLVLSNLQSKQTQLFDELQALHDDPAITGDDEKVKETIYNNLVSLRARSLSSNKELQNYQIDSETFNFTLKQEKKKTSFTSLEKKIRLLSEETKKFTKGLEGKTVSSAIFPSIGPNGNISGQGFPKNTWSLTYDDGPAATTDRVINNLKERKIPATFFVLAKQALAYSNTLKKLSDAQFNIASHSYGHAQLTKVGPIRLEKEIGESSRIIASKIGRPVKLFRLPYGAGVNVSKIRAKIANHNMVHVFWNVDTLDWQDKNPKSIYRRTLKQMSATSSNAGIILFHDIHPQSVTASTMLMDYFNKEKLKVCNVQDVIDKLNNQPSACH